MFLRVSFAVVVVLLAGLAPACAIEIRGAQLEAEVEALFEGGRDMAEIKLAIDRMVAPGVDVAARLKLIDRMAGEIERMRAEAGATSDFDRLAILRRYLYEPGPWNGGKVFLYDPDDPFGRAPENRLLSDYLTDRKGNCVSMPTLMMVLGNRMGLRMTLAHAPWHNLVKFTDGEGREWNLEATSGGGFTRESHYRKLMPDITDAAIRNGIYLRGLPREELIAATVSGMVVSGLMEEGRLEEALAIADRLLEHAPGAVHLRLTRASIKDEMNKKIPKDWVVDKAKKKVGARYKDPNNKGSSVRVDQGNPDSSNPSQQVDHVVVNSGGKIIGRYGDPLNVPLKDDPLNGHIPLSEYNNWGSWNHP